MASNQNASKFKVKDVYYSIKDAYARETKADKDNPSFTGKIELNKGSQTTGANAVSLGYRNDSTGVAAVALGSQNEAAADFSAAAGFKNRTNTAYSTAIGKYNNPILNDLFEIGNGSSENNRINIFRVTSDGDVYILNDVYIKGTTPGQSPLNIRTELNRIEQEIRDSQYTLEPATTQSLGGVIIGDNINIDRTGRISVSFPEIPDPYELPAASEDELGGIKVGENLEIENDGTLNVVLPDFPEPYTLPVATPTTLGGIKVSESKGFRLENGVLAYAILKLNQNNPSGTGSLKMNTSNTQGTNSVALGSNNLANSKDSIALGLLNVVTGTAAAAIGNNNVVDGNNSVTLGINNNVTSQNAFTIGSGNENNSQSVLIGQGLESDYNNQFIIGQYNNNSTDNFLEIGKGSNNNRSNILEISNNNSLNFDDKFKISSDGNLMIDKRIYITKDTTTGNYVDLLSYVDTADTALANQNTLLANRVTVLENKHDYELPTASDTTLGGIKVGNNLSIDQNGVLSADINFSPTNFKCYGYFSHNRLNLTDIGENSFASNGSALTLNSTAFGFESIAGKKIITTIEEEDPETGETIETTETSFSGNISFAEGYQTQAAGYCSHTAGYKTSSDYAYQFIIGYYNDNKQNNLFEIGNGTEATHSNAFEVDKNGNVIIPNSLTVNGIDVSTGTVLITSAAYEELTQEEKNLDIFYLITDTQSLYYKENPYGGDMDQIIGLINTTKTELLDDIQDLSDTIENTKQDKLTEGNHITIDSNNIIDVNVDNELSDFSTHPVENRVIKARLDEVFQSVSNGKELVASAITDKGVPTGATDSFATMADNISRIEGGGGQGGISYDSEDLELQILDFDIPIYECENLSFRVKTYIEL